MKSSLERSAIQHGTFAVPTSANPTAIFVPTYDASHVPSSTETSSLATTTSSTSRLQDFQILKSKLAQGRAENDAAALRELERSTAAGLAAQRKRAAETARKLESMARDEELAAHGIAREKAY